MQDRRVQVMQDGSVQVLQDGSVQLIFNVASLQHIFEGIADDTDHHE